jgi:hypothetical protein
VPGARHPADARSRALPRVRLACAIVDLRTEIEINAPSAAVWRVLTDTARYHEWNPFITSLEGKLAVGEDLSVVVSPPNGSDMRFRPRVLKVEEGVELRWRGVLLAPWLFSGEHFFVLRELSPNRTRLTHGEDFRGFLKRFVGAQLKRTADGFVLMNLALKRRVEAEG